MDISRLAVVERPPLLFWVSESLHMRLLAPADAEALFRLVDSNRSYLRQWLPWLDMNNSVVDAEIFIRSLGELYRRQMGFSCGVFRETNLIGLCGFHDFDRAANGISMGYWLDQHHQGQGIMSCCVRALMNYGFDKMALEKVYIAVAEHNLQSRAIPERLGFRVEAIEPDAEYLYDHYVDHVRYIRTRVDNG